VQLKLTEFETRIADLERLKDVFEGKSTGLVSSKYFAPRAADIQTERKKHAEW
jgi:hypothetical protein